MLNARRHRSGNYPLERAEYYGRVCERCSTPEGIGAGITRRWRTDRWCRESCSTPEGIGAGITSAAICHRVRSIGCAQRPKASERELLDTRCPSCATYRMVLNARRHRSGNYHGTPHDRSAPQRVLNARRHRSGNYSSPVAGALYVQACSTPEGIGAGITGMMH